MMKGSIQSNQRKDLEGRTILLKKKMKIILSNVFCYFLPYIYFNFSFRAYNSFSTMLKLTFNVGPNSIFPHLSKDFDMNFGFKSFKAGLPLIFFVVGILRGGTLKNNVQQISFKNHPCFGVEIHKIPTIIRGKFCF